MYQCVFYLFAYYFFYDYFICFYSSAEPLTSAASSALSSTDCTQSTVQQPLDNLPATLNSLTMDTHSSKTATPQVFDQGNSASQDSCSGQSASEPVGLNTQSENTG